MYTIHDLYYQLPVATNKINFIAENSSVEVKLKQTISGQGTTNLGTPYFSIAKLAYCMDSFQL